MVAMLSALSGSKMRLVMGKGQISKWQTLRRQYPLGYRDWSIMCTHGNSFIFVCTLGIRFGFGFRFRFGFGFGFICGQRGM